MGIIHLYVPNMLRYLQKLSLDTAFVILCIILLLCADKERPETVFLLLINTVQLLIGLRRTCAATKLWRYFDQF